MSYKHTPAAQSTSRPIPIQFWTRRSGKTTRIICWYFATRTLPSLSRKFSRKYRNFGNSATEERRREKRVCSPALSTARTVNKNCITVRRATLRNAKIFLSAQHIGRTKKNAAGIISGRWFLKRWCGCTWKKLSRMWPTTKPISASLWNTKCG